MRSNDSNNANERGTVLVTGASGLVGRSLLPALRDAGYAVRTVSRRSGDIVWDGTSPLPEGALDGVGAIVHLAGEPIAQRWTRAVKDRILASRVDSTARLAAAAAAADPSPALVCASGVSYYGTRSDSPVDESAPPGAGFLAEVAQRWEAAAQPLVDAGGRVAHLRTGVVLSPDGGALAKMLPPFRLGLGGPVGDGGQRMAWIGLPDLVAVYLRAVADPEWSGPFNAVAPEPVSNRAFSRALGRALGRPAAVPVPRFAIRALFGEMGAETVLADQPVLPGRLRAAGFSWRHADIDACLQAILGSPQ